MHMHILLSLLILQQRERETPLFFIFEGSLSSQFFFLLIDFFSY
jgi:hypothetical protein